MKVILYSVAAVLSVAGCVSSRRAPDKPGNVLVSAALSEEGPEGKRLTLHFSPELPEYGVVYHRENRMSEVRWVAQAKDSFDKEFVFGDRGGAIKRAVLSVDAAAGTGSLRIWGESVDSFVLTRQGTGDLVLYGKSAAARGNAGYVDRRRQKVNLNVKNAPLDKLLRTLASESQHSLVFGSAVNGNVTVTLQNMPYEQAIDMILRPTGYRAEHAGDVTVIRSAKDDKNFRAFRLMHVDATAAQKQIQDVISKDAQLSVDSNTNTIFVVDRVEMLKNLEMIIATLDQEPRQVEVEAAIAQVTLQDNTQYGIDYNAMAHMGNQSQVQSNITQSQISPFTGRSLPTGFYTGQTQAPKGFFVNLSWQSINSMLGFLATQDKVNVIARPRVLALNDQEAQVLIGSKLGYKTVTVTTTGTIEDVKFLEVGTMLKIKPHITETGDILMALSPELSDGQIDATTGLPSESTTTTSTKVMAHDGQTIILGGLMRDRMEKAVNKVPLLGDLPLVGFFFSSVTKSRVKDEIAILLTPRIVTPQLLTNDAMEGGQAVQRFYDDTGIVPGK